MASPASTPQAIGASLHRQRIYCADPARDHGVLEPVLQRGRRAVNFHLIVEQWDRIGQFYAAFPAGHATASAALQRLNRFQASNRFYAANRELGRALKTEFVLQYMSEPQLRAKVRRGLLKVEQLHALARAVYYGQRGRISAREVYDQMNACSCLTLILASIVYWQAREISRLAAAPDFPFPAAARQPDRVEERHPLRREHDRPRQAHEAPHLARGSRELASRARPRQSDSGSASGATPRPGSPKRSRRPPPSPETRRLRRVTRAGRYRTRSVTRRPSTDSRPASDRSRGLRWRRCTSRRIRARACGTRWRRGLDGDRGGREAELHSGRRSLAAAERADRHLAGDGAGAHRLEQRGVLGAPSGGRPSDLGLRGRRARSYGPRGRPWRRRRGKRRLI